MRVVELILDDEQDNFVEAISVVEFPAIEEDFVALQNEKKNTSLRSTTKRKKF